MIAKLTYAIIDPFILQAWVSLHTILQFKIPLTAFLSKPPNIIFVNDSAYTVIFSSSVIFNNYHDGIHYWDIFRATIVIDKHYYSSAL